MSRLKKSTLVGQHAIQPATASSPTFDKLLSRAPLLEERRGKRKAQRKSMQEIKRSVLLILAKKEAEGKTLPEIKINAGLSETEQKILEEFVINDLTTTAAARKIGVSTTAIILGVRRLENKLLGKDSHADEKEKYIQMTHDEQREEMRKLNAKSVREADYKNRYLCSVAKGTGVFYEFFPRKTDKYLERANRLLKQFQKITKKMLKEKTKEQILFLFKPPERELISKLFLVEKQLETGHDLATGKTCRMLRLILRKLKNDTRIEEQNRKLREMIITTETERIMLFKKQLDIQEIIVFEDRGTKEDGPSLLVDIAEKLGISDERVRQIESNILRKLKDFLAGKRIIKISRSRHSLEVKKLFEKLEKEGLLEQIKKQLSGFELQIFLIPVTGKTLKKIANQKKCSYKHMFAKRRALITKIRKIRIILKKDKR
ncbi:MAG: sigma factor-like helix-turn-helix DNA-binding protein [Candidatus Micrarchaeota archaeon]